MRLRVLFFKTESGNEPVREWLRSLLPEERKIIGEDIKTAQFGWPLGLPLIRKLDRDLWEVRSTLPGRIARTIFTVSSDVMVLLHGFVKKSQQIPETDLKLAKRRLAQLHSSQ
jgi:phage-related protein